MFSLVTLYDTNGARLTTIQKHPWTLKWDIVLNIPLMLRYTWLSLLSISLLCSGLCPACVCQRLLGNHWNSCSLWDLTFFPPLCEDQNREQTLLIITHHLLHRSRDQPCFITFFITLFIVSYRSHTKSLKYFHQIMNQRKHLLQLWLLRAAR